MHSWSTFGAQTHKIHHGPDLGEAITSRFIVFSVPSHGASTQMSICPETPKLGILKFSKLGFLQLRRPITLYEDL